MKHEILKPIQKQWLEWLLGDGYEWMGKYINAPGNHQRINWTYVNGIYDVATKQLLNFLLGFFKRDIEAQKMWREFQTYKTK